MDDKTLNTLKSIMSELYIAMNTNTHSITENQDKNSKEIKSELTGLIYGREINILENQDKISKQIKFALENHSRGIRFEIKGLMVLIFFVTTLLTFLDIKIFYELEQKQEKIENLINVVNKQTNKQNKETKPTTKPTFKYDSKLN